VYDRGSLSRSGAGQTSTLTAALVSSSAGTPVVACGAVVPSSLAPVAVSKAAAPQSYVYEDNKTYTVLDNCTSSPAAAAAAAHCQTDKLARVQTTNDAARSVSIVT